jgi:hypothetical protein
MVENTVVKYIPNYILLASATGLVYINREKSQIVINKVKNLGIKLLEYYRYILSVNNNLFLKFRFYLCENRKITQYGLITISVAGISALIYNNRSRINIIPSSLMNIDFYRIPRKLISQ